jgi:DNA repair photolyase
MKVEPIKKKSSTLHDFPYDNPKRKCPHFWIINVTPPGQPHCIHRCIFCYARDAIFSKPGKIPQVYSNLPELVEKDLKRIRISPPISISNITDPCQDIPYLKEVTKSLIRLIMRWGVSFMITTKGNPEFLFDLSGFLSYPNKFIAFSVEGPEEVIERLSPNAPSFQRRIEAIAKTTKAGVKVSVRLDPLFPHLYRAIYGKDWLRKVEDLIRLFAKLGTSHIVCSTGRLYKPGIRDIYMVVKNVSEREAERFLDDYRFDGSYTSKGYFLRRNLRLRLHLHLRSFTERLGMTYSSCIENHPWETDSKRIPHCEGIPLPFVEKVEDRKFKPIDGCSGNCFNCKGGIPPCKSPLLRLRQPFRINYLK